MKADDLDERDAAYDAVLFDRGEALPDLKECYEESERDVLMRYYSVQLMGFSGEPGAIPTLVEALDDRSPTVRAEACRALEDLAARDAIAPLRARLNDLDPDVRQAAREALEALG